MAQKKPAKPAKPVRKRPAKAAPAPPPQAKPIPVMLPPTNEASIMSNLVSREIMDPSGKDIPPSPTIILLRETVNAIARGEDISQYVEALKRVTSNQSEKADLILAQLGQIDDERLPGLLEMQHSSERLLQQAARRSDVTVPEALATWKLANQEVAMIRETKLKARGHTLDSSSVVGAFQNSRHIVDKATVTKWEYTTPQGRELIRQRLWDLKKAMTMNKAVEAEVVEVKSNPSTS